MSETAIESFIDIVFDGPPSHESGRFVEVENEKRASINAGEWIQRDDGFWVLRIQRADVQAAVKKERAEIIEQLRYAAVERDMGTVGVRTPIEIVEARGK